MIGIVPANDRPALQLRRISVGAAVRQHTPRRRRKVHPDSFSEALWSFVAQEFGLCRREVETLRLLCRGLENEQIAATLQVAYPTLRCYVRALYRKLDCTDRTDLLLTLIAVEKNLLIHPYG